MTAAVMDDRLFADGVMARIANEPLPTPARALRIAATTFDAGLAAGATWTAWHLATSRNTHVRRGMRIRSALLVATLMALLAMGTTLAAAGATVVVRTIIDEHLPQLITNRGSNGPADDNRVHGLPAIVPPSSVPGSDPADDDGPKGPDEDATNEPGDDHGGGSAPDETGAPDDDDDNPGGDDDDNSGNDDDDNSGGGGDDNSGNDDGDDSGGGEPGDEESPEATDEPDEVDGDGDGEAAEPSDAPDDDDLDDDAGGGEG